MNEVWKKLVYPTIEEQDNRFEISSCGRLRNVKTGHIYKPAILRTGYYSVRTSIGSDYRKIHIIIHKAVANTFLENVNNEPCVNHIDGNKLNNTVENLEWCSYSHNLSHAYETKLFNKDKISSELNHNSKLTYEDIEYIRSHYVRKSRKFSSYALAKKFNVSKTTILSIVKNKTWKHLEDEV